MPLDDPRLEKIADLLEKQILDSSLTDGTIWHNLALSKRTFYRLKPKATHLLATRASERQKAIEHTKLQELKEAVKTGLKSKTDRVLILQKEIDATLNELYGQDVINYSRVGNKLLNVKQQLTVEQKALMRRTIRELQSEISQMEEDYAPKKFEDVSQKPTVIFPGDDN